MAISTAGFGYQIDWEDDGVLPPGHKMTFKRSVEIVGSKLFVRLLCPGWILEWAPIQAIRDVRDGFAEFRVCPLQTHGRTVVPSG